MDWRLKAAFFWGFKYVPAGAELHYFAQRHITHAMPRRLTPLADVAHSYMRHPRVLKEVCPNYPAGHQLEFGAGRDLFGNLLAWCCGFERQTVLDIVPLMKVELVNHTIAALKAHPLPDFVREPPRELSASDPLRELRDIYGIEYVAPGDARAVNLPDGSIDRIVSTNTLEHIPEEDIAQIFREGYRVLKEGGVLSQVIDYSDHYVNSDSKLNDYSFLAHSDFMWRFFNPPDHYQNRLRHSDYRRLIERSGFEIASDLPTQRDNARQQLSQVRLAPRFAAYAEDDVLPTAGHFVAFKPFAQQN